MKTIVLAAALLALAMPFAIAEEHANVWDQTADLLTGHSDNVPINLSLEVCKEFTPDSYFPVIKNIDKIQVGIKGITPLGDNFGDKAEVEIPVRLIF